MESNNGVFSELQKCCLQLLQLSLNPNKHSPSLSHSLSLLRSSPPSSLQPFLDYVMFPLLRLSDDAVSCRSLKKPYSKVRPANNQTLNKVNDFVAEGVLRCLEELLSKCHLGSVHQMVVVMRKLAYGAMVEAAEEFHEGVVRCFKALLLNLTPCFKTSCSCRHSRARPFLSDTRSESTGSTTTGPSKHQCQQTECLIAFLQSESASSAVGEWLCHLLDIADAEVTRGLRGSAKLRIEALLTVRVLVAKVGSPDSLAFFLPGVVSRLAKVLKLSKSMISGAAGNTEAIEHAITGLAEILIIVFQDDANGVDPHVDSALHGVHSHDSGSSYLEQLRRLQYKAQPPSHSSGDTSGARHVPKQDRSDKQCRNTKGGVGPLCVKRTPEWIADVSNNVDPLLSSTFPHLCTHPSKRVRRGLLSSIQGLLSNCSYVLKGIRLMLLECLCTLVCDDSAEVSAAAQDFLSFLFSTCGNDTVQDDVAELLNSLLDKLPKSVLGSEDSVALSSAQQLLVVIYYSGPQLVLDHFLSSPVKAAKLFDVFALCFSQESVFAGSLGKTVLSTTPSTTGYLHSLAELSAGGKNSFCKRPVVRFEESEVSGMTSGNTFQDYELPRMPPWFVHVGSYKLYQALAGILQLIGLSLLACRSDVTLMEIVEIPLSFLRKLVSEFRVKDCNQESWDSWYKRSQSGQLLRQASTAVCIINEMLFGMSDQTTNILKDIFHVSVAKKDEKLMSDGSGFSHISAKSHWEAAHAQCVRQHVINCVGIILHEYMTPEVWDVPLAPIQSGEKNETISMHFFRDVAMLHEVLIDGIGIFNLCLGKYFISSGFLCSSLYLLLENLICSNSEVRHAADAVLQVISTTSGYPTVGHLVMANADYVIDSLCHQLRHLDLNPEVPNVLAAMLSYVGVAHKILPLLEEPMSCVSTELEILGRHHHPELTIPFLKAVAEIAKAAKHEADGLPAQSESFAYVIAKLSALRMELRKDNVTPGELETDAVLCDVVSMEELESVLFTLNDNTRYRRIIASIATSCLTAVIPLVASTEEPICLVTLDIIEHVITTLAKVEETYAHEKETKEVVAEVASLCSFYHLSDVLEATEEGADENKLLPAMNKIWPFLVTCVQNKIPVPIRRCVEVISSTVRICGGNFFTRRFHNDGPNFWKLLTTSPFTRKSIRNKEATPLLLPYRNTSRTLEEPVSETSNLKTQEAVLRMIANISHDKRSSSALNIALKKVCGLVVGVACSSVTGLRDASIAALSGLATIDPDLVWLLLADVYYSFKGEDIRSLPVFPELEQVLPAPSTSKDYLFVQYGGQTYGFDINFSSVEIVFKKLYPEMVQ